MRDITIADRRLDFEICRTLNKVLSEPRTSLTIRFCRELNTSLQIQQEQQELEAIRTRIQASRRQVAKTRRRRTTDSSSSSSSSPEASLQALLATTQGFEAGSSGTESGDQEYQILHSASTEAKRHIIWEHAEDPRIHAAPASTAGRHLIANIALQAQKEPAAVSTNRPFVPTTDPQAEEADLAERRMLIDERETKISTTERNLRAREALLRIREEIVFGREAALLERETRLMERERAFVLRNHAEL